MIQLHPFLDQDFLCLVTQALVICRMDYRNVLYTGLPLKCIWKLQLVQSAAAWAVFGAPRMAHVTPLLHKLHWLLVCYGVQIKVLV